MSLASSDIKLILIDTTLDLSQKAKVCYSNPNSVIFSYACKSLPINGIAFTFNMSLFIWMLQNIILFNFASASNSTMKCTGQVTKPQKSNSISRPKL